MSLRFIHTADIHLGKTYRNSPGEIERYEDFFRCFSSIVSDAIDMNVDFVLIAGDLFHTGQILPRTFAKTIETLLPLKEAGIPCIAVEGNHDWIHRRDSISWMEALSQMGYIHLLRPSRDEDGRYIFSPFDYAEGFGGHIEIGGLNIYGLGYIGTQAGSHVPRICEAISTRNNLLLFHVGIWQYSPVEIGNMKPEEALPLADVFEYVALGHGHKPYTLVNEKGLPFAFNPGAPERVNFGEERYDKGYYLVTAEQNGSFRHEFRPTSPRPMIVTNIELGGAQDPEEALDVAAGQIKKLLAATKECGSPLIELKLRGAVAFHPFELGREYIRKTLEEQVPFLHLEIKNHLHLASEKGGIQESHKNLEEIERDVLLELIEADSKRRESASQISELALQLRRLVQQGCQDEEELLGLLDNQGLWQ